MDFFFFFFFFYFGEAVTELLNSLTKIFFMQFNNPFNQELFSKYFRTLY